MKKIITFIIFISVILNTQVFASDNVLKSQMIDKIAPYAQKDSEEKIPRKDCVISIVKAIGANEDLNEQRRRVAYESPPFGSEYTIFQEDFGYLIAAHFDDILCGEPYYYNSEQMGVLITPFRAVKAKECLAFMLRCLKPMENIEWNNTFQDSIDIGLINADEAKAFENQKYLMAKDFRVLLSRMLDMKRYLYYTDEAKKSVWRNYIETDVSGSMTYLEQYLKNN